MPPRVGGRVGRGIRLGKNLVFLAVALLVGIGIGISIVHPTKPHSAMTVKNSYRIRKGGDAWSGILSPSQRIDPAAKQQEAIDQESGEKVSSSVDCLRVCVVVKIVFEMHVVSATTLVDDQFADEFAVATGQSTKC